MNCYSEYKSGDKVPCYVCEVDVTAGEDEAHAAGETFVIAM